MAEIKFKENPVHTCGELPPVGEMASEPQYNEALAALKTGSGESIELNICSTTSKAEHSRSNSPDEPCDDGRSGPV